MNRHTLQNTAHMVRTVARLNELVASRNLEPSCVSAMAHRLANETAQRIERGEDGPYTVATSHMHVHLYVLEASR